MKTMQAVSAKNQIFDQHGSENMIIVAMKI